MWHRLALRNPLDRGYASQTNNRASFVSPSMSQIFPSAFGHAETEALDGTSKAFGGGAHQRQHSGSRAEPTEPSRAELPNPPARYPQREERGFFGTGGATPSRAREEQPEEEAYPEDGFSSARSVVSRAEPSRGDRHRAQSVASTPGTHRGGLLVDLDPELANPSAQKPGRGSAARLKGPSNTEKRLKERDLQRQKQEEREKEARRARKARAMAAAKRPLLEVVCLLAHMYIGQKYYMQIHKYASVHTKADDGDLERTCMNINTTYRNTSI